MSTKTTRFSWLIEQHDMIGIFFLAMGTLLYEVTLTRIFSFVVWSNYAFLIVSTALLGFGIAGVTLAVTRGKGRWFPKNHVYLYCILFALTAVLSLELIIKVPLIVSRFDLAINWLYLLIIYMAVTVPFFFAGLAISILLSSDSKRVHKLYFWDLVGAAIGSFLLSLVIIPIGAAGAIILSALVGIVAAIFFFIKRSKVVLSVLMLIAVLIAGMVPFGERIFSIQSHENKRWYQSVRNDTVFSGWSTLSKVDVVRYDNNRRREIFINGGENESYLAQWDNNKHWSDTTNFPYVFIGGGGKTPKVMVIGSSGGTEVAFALAHGASMVHAVEMDPLIARIVEKDMADWNNHMYQSPRVKQFNDEGRSFIVNTHEKYDLILMRNNFTPIAFASGSINLSETYLLSVEGMNSYLSRLTDNGVLGIIRWGTSRLCTTFRNVAEQNNIQNIDKNIMIISGIWWGQHGFYFKKTPFTAREISDARAYAEKRGRKMLYYPGMDKDTNLYSKILLGNDYRQYYHVAGYDLTPATDDHPFFDHFLHFGSFVDINDPVLPEELREIAKMLRWEPTGLMKKIVGNQVLSKSDVPVMAIAFEGVLISLLGIFVPLFLFARKKEAKDNARWPVIFYFSFLGMAFIMIELCFIKQYILFLGHPAYAIAMIISGLLVFSGIGSFLSERFGDEPQAALRFVFPAIFLLIALAIFSTPLIFKIFLGTPIAVRALVTLTLLAPLGICMGMPFPLGLRLIHQVSSNLVGWAWGINGFMTVIGSVLTIVISLLFGFNMVLWTAGFLYLCCLLVYRHMGSAQA
jgi:predicted membrane-bound spermidine synthase